MAVDISCYGRVFVAGHVGYFQNVAVVHIQPVCNGCVPETVDVAVIDAGHGFSLFKRVFDVSVSERRVISCSENQS